MTTIRVATVPASYVLMDRDAGIDRVAVLTAAAAGDGAQLVVFPEVFVPGTPIWIDTQPSRRTGVPALPAVWQTPGLPPSAPRLRILTTQPGSS